MDNFCGKRLDGRYEIREIIGVGGMAVVYKAYDNIDDRIVAIKILKDEYLTNEEFKRRFKNESKAIAVLSHPNIVRVYNVSFGDRIQYIVMEYVDGITLKEYIEQQGVVNWKEAVHFVGQILAALQHAHDKGIVHQDIKPQNIMLLQDGTIKVTDFGIARFSRTDSNVTSENAIGSVHYISPEQARGEMTDDKADIYSVGVVMYEMLTGQLPFQSDSAVSVAIMQLQQDPRRPREIVPTLPLGLEQITMRAMQKNPSDRYGSAAEMLMDINEFKRNPAVKFNYTYFVDREPTKYVRNGADVSNVGVKSADSAEIAESERKKSINKTTAVMMGAIAGVVVLIAIICAVVFALNNQKIEVPNFKRLDYLNQIAHNEKYKDFEFEIIYDEDAPAADEGLVIAQDPEESSRVKKGTKITLTVAGSKGKTIVIDASVIGMTQDQALNKLHSLGIDKSDISVVIEYSETAEPGTVIRVSPEVGTSIVEGTRVTIFVATDEKETKIVPKIEGCDKALALQLLDSAGLAAGKITEVDSELAKDVVVSQSIKEGESVPAGSKIDFTVSKGAADEPSVDVTVTLPNLQKSGQVKIYINEKLFFESKPNEYLMDGAKVTFTLKGKEAYIKGKEADSTYKIMVNDSKIQEGKVDFTKNPAVVTEKTDYPVLIDVTGKTKDEAISMLNAAGFTNIEIVNTESNSITAGYVISQSPVGDGVTRISTDSKITLKISIGPAAE
ncbi:MAG: Stk1 family PASTA domain-containing Ser/Thr kinase [Candidatus Fimenecus sp.]